MDDIKIWSLTGMVFFFSACNLYDQRDESDRDEIPLFRLKNSKETGVDFENRLHETDTFNSIFYEYYYNGAGLAIADINNDGMSDIFFGANMENCRLYLNKGNLKFEDITEKAGIDTRGSWVTGVTMVDLDQDGWTDIYLSVGGNIVDDYRNILLMNNGATGSLTFTDRAQETGLDDDSYSTQSAFFDYDGDGDLDVYLLTSSMNIPNKNAIRDRTGDGSLRNTDKLYRNEGLSQNTGLPHFRDVSKEAGIVWDGFGLGIGISDFNRDGWPDIYVANDYLSNDLLYINQGDGTFSERIRDFIKHTSYSAMGMDISDFNNDGLVDLFTLDMLPEDYFRKRIMAGNMREYNRYRMELDKGYSRQYIRNMLQLNNGEIGGRQSFSEIGQLAGIFETDWSWASLFADFDNDGYKDLFIGNGIPRDLSNMDFTSVVMNLRREDPDMSFSIMGEILREELDELGHVKKSNVIYKNNGTLIFEDKTRAWGIDKPSYSTGAVFSDLDNDGDLDIVLNNINDPATIYENTLYHVGSSDSSRHYLQILLQGNAMNREGIGTKITLRNKGALQYYEHFPVRGFQSMVDPRIHFGTGNAESIDTLHVIWPDGKEQFLFAVKTDTFLTINYEEAALAQTDHKEPRLESRLFEEMDESLGINYRHQEKEFVDFMIQPLLPHMFSREGPGIAVGDINNDNLEDFYVGGSTGFYGMFFIQQADGKFRPKRLYDNPNFEDMGALLFDADNDGDEDLYVVSGGTGLPPGNQFYTDRLYINDGEGDFARSNTSLPVGPVSGSQVTACDFDRDGDMDLLVCGRVKLEEYPFPDRSYLLRNDTRPGTDQVVFTDVTGKIAPDIEQAGLVASALWTDYDRDGWIDIILAGEWMPLTVFRNMDGQFKNVTSETGLEIYTGWWNSLAGADFDRDGDIDFVAGNLGLNTRFKVSPEQPMRITAKDFDKNGYIDPVCSYYVQGKSYPIYHRNLMMDQMPFIHVKYAKYEEYARATMDDIFNEAQIEGAYVRECRYFNTAYIENRGDGSFRVHSLPIEAQLAPVFGILTGDYNHDGYSDILLSGNSYSFNVDDGQQDAMIGLYLEGDGSGDFKAIHGRESGFFVDGDAKGMAELVSNDGSSIIFTARNSGKLAAHRVNNKADKLMKINSEDRYAEIVFGTGETEYREFYHGSGYLSSSTRKMRISADMISVKITTYAGESRMVYGKDDGGT